MSSRRGSFAVCTLGETSLLAIGGFNGSESVASCEVLDLRSGKWRPAASMSAGRAFGGGVAVNADQVQCVLLPSSQQTNQHYCHYMIFLPGGKVRRADKLQFKAAIILPQTIAVSIISSLACLCRPVF